MKSKQSRVKRYKDLLNMFRKNKKTPLIFNISSLVYFKMQYKQERNNHLNCIDQVKQVSPEVISWLMRTNMQPISGPRIN